MPDRNFWKKKNKKISSICYLLNLFAEETELRLLLRIIQSNIERLPTSFLQVLMTIGETFLFFRESIAGNFM